MEDISGPMHPTELLDIAHEQWSRAGWSAFADVMSTLNSLPRAAQLFTGGADLVLAPLGLTYSNYSVLMLLHLSREGRLSMSKIGRRMRVHPTTVTGAVDRLERKGLVKRVPLPNDRRATLAAITNKGTELALKATAKMNDEMFTEIRGLTPRQTQTLRGLLRLVIDAYST